MGLLDSQGVARLGRAEPTAARRCAGIKRHVPACSLSFVLASLVTAAGMRLDRAAWDGWRLERIKADGIHVGARMDAVARRHGLEVQVTTRERAATGLQPLPLRWRIEAAFGTQTTRDRRLARNLEHSPAAADAIAIAHSDPRDHRDESCAESSNTLSDLHSLSLRALYCQFNTSLSHT